MGILPLLFKNGENAESHGLTGAETFSISLNNGDIQIKQDLVVKVSNGK
jgi:aconitate hydratase